MRLRQEAETAQQHQVEQNAAINIAPQNPIEILKTGHQSQVVLEVSSDRLFELYYSNFWRSAPMVLPHHFLQERFCNNPEHGMGPLLAVLQWIGSIYAPWIPSEPYYENALHALQHPVNTPFNVQALMLLGHAQFHSDIRDEGDRSLSVAVTMALQLGMNDRNFAQAFGEGNPVLEESWRRTYYMLYAFDQSFTIVRRRYTFPLGNATNTVELPCDDEMYISGQIPQPATMQDYHVREFEDTLKVFSSMAYMHDINAFLTSLMKTMVEGGSFDEHLISIVDAKIASWRALLPVCKQDPLQSDGTVDEVIWQAHSSAAILMTIHRPFSALTFSQEEFSTQSFMVLMPVYIASSKRAAHTSRALKALEVYTKLLAIPTVVEQHSIFSMNVVAQIATIQISACKNLLTEHALTIGRDRLRLFIGYLNTMGSFWPLGKKMAKEVKAIARASFFTAQVTEQASATDEIEVTRDDYIWSIDPSAQIDIYSGTVLPIDWSAVSLGYNSSASSNYTASTNTSTPPSNMVYPGSSTM
ncbi:hypothetical protein GQ44DRAFT_610186 [Phaeosphaeriaceae sp. PMI808]|nr:hypothetical protein GQ44DRAFT_610186 [Phaeosphaeriaceae sp. PMI808]